MSDLFGNHIVGFPTGWLKCYLCFRKQCMMELIYDLGDFGLDNITITEEMEDSEPDSLIQIAMIIVGILSVSGTIGNALVLYVFSRQKQKLSSTVFILTLAGTDFISSLVTMPYTIAMELLRYRIEYDIVCKLYHFLVTTTIPFSAFVMVAIAVDRYLCIVHPFKHTMTIKRAKILVTLLAGLAGILGLLSCLVYGVSSEAIYDPNVAANYTSLFDSTGNDTLGSTRHFSYWNFTIEDLKKHSYFVNKGICHKDGVIFDKSFFDVYQKIYSAFYAVCAIIVIVLYAIIYRSVLSRRRQRLHLTKKCCGFWAQSANVENEHEQTEFTILNNGRPDKDKSTVLNGSSYRDKETIPLQKVPSERNSNVESQAKSDTDALVRPSGVSRAKMEKLRMANIKTALMLSIVALTYIIAFTPAWLMAHQVVPMNVIVFYLYFTYNVANPVIYAFLNQGFRTHLQFMINCES